MDQAPDTDQQDERERDARDDQRALHAVLPAPAERARAFFAEQIVQIESTFR